jgi:hypothetical protein
MLKFGLFAICTSKLINEGGEITSLLPSFGYFCSGLILTLSGLGQSGHNAIPLETVSRLRKFPVELRMPVCKPATA